jgi:hypothetical protein
MAKPAKPRTSASVSARAKAKPAGKPSKVSAKPPRARGRGDAPDASLFLPLTSGEAADATRLLIEDRRVAAMAKVGRYRIIATEPLAVKPPHALVGHRLARVVAYDYSADRCVDAVIDLDASVVAHLDINRSQPMLSREEEAAAAGVALADESVRSQLAMGDQPMLTTHYWSRSSSEQASSRRSAAVVFGQDGAHPTLIAVVDLLDAEVTQVVPASAW